MSIAALFLAAAVPAVPMAPLGPWVVEAAPDTCSVSRDYGTAANRVTVGFQPLFNNDTFDVVVITNTRDGQQFRGVAKISVDTEPTQFAVDYFSVQVVGKRQRYTRVTVLRSLLDSLRAASTLSIKAKPVDLSVQLTSFQKAMKTFDQCQTGLLQSWNVDPASLDPGRAPKPHNLEASFTPDSYPKEAISSGTLGRVITVLQIDTKGTVTNCRVVASAGKLLNEGTCRQAMKVRFDPGRGVDGKPAPSIFVLPVRWVMY